jgi:hypothetical protein
MKSSLSPAILALGLALASSLSAAPVWSRPEPTSSELSVARRLFEEGKAAEDAGDFRAAAEKFRRAASIKDTPGIRFHLARCEEEQGAFVEALVEYDRARELLESGVKAADVEKLLPGARQRAMTQVALLTIKLPPDVGDANVELDGKPLAASVLGVALPINPGKHRLTAAAAGRANYSFNIDVRSGEGVQLDVELPLLANAAPAPIAPPRRPETAPRRAESSTQGRSALLITEATLGAAGLTTGILFMVLRGAADDRYQTANQTVLASVGGSDPRGVACSGEMPPAACAELREAGRDRTRNTTIATAGFITAGASAAAFGLTYWLWPDTSAPSSAGVSIGVAGSTVSLAGRF